MSLRFTRAKFFRSQSQGAGAAPGLYGACCTAVQGYRDGEVNERESGSEQLWRDELGLGRGE